MAKKEPESGIFTEQATITSPEVAAKSPPVAFRTRSGHSKIPTKPGSNLSPTKVVKEVGVESDINIPKSDPEYSSESDEEVIIDPAKAEQNAEEVAAMPNEELKERLTTLGIAIGPIVPSTRKIYEKKLVNLMNKAELQYSTDEEASVGAIAEKPEPEATKPKKVRKKREETNVKDKFSDDEEEVPVVRNTSSRRKSSRLAAKPTEQVKTEEPITEEPEKEAEAVPEPEVITENGTGDAPAATENEEEAIIEATVEAPAESAPVEESAPKPVAKELPKIPYNIVAIVLVVAILLAMIYQQRETHVGNIQFVYDVFKSKYSQLYDYLMPEVEQLPEVDPVPPVAPVE